MLQAGRCISLRLKFVRRKGKKKHGHQDPGGGEERIGGLSRNQSVSGLRVCFNVCLSLSLLLAGPFACLLLLGCETDNCVP